MERFDDPVITSRIFFVATDDLHLEQPLARLGFNPQ